MSENFGALTAVNLKTGATETQEGLRPRITKRVCFNLKTGKYEGVNVVADFLNNGKEYPAEEWIIVDGIVDPYDVWDAYDGLSIADAWSKYVSDLRAVCEGN